MNKINAIYAARNVKEQKFGESSANDEFRYFHAPNGEEEIRPDPLS